MEKIYRVTAIYYGALGEYSDEEDCNEVIGYISDPTCLANFAKRHLDRLIQLCCVDASGEVYYGRKYPVMRYCLDEIPVDKLLHES